MDRDLNAAKNLAALAELAFVCLMAQMATGIPVDWSKLPLRPYGWEPDRDTRRSRGCARARGPRAEGAERKTARAHRGGGAALGSGRGRRPGPARRPPVQRCRMARLRHT